MGAGRHKKRQSKIVGDGRQQLVEHISSRFFFSSVFLFGARDISAGAHRASGGRAARDMGGRSQPIFAGLAKNEEGERRRKCDPGVGSGEAARIRDGKDGRSSERAPPPREFETDPREFETDPREFEKDPREFEKDPREFEKDQGGGASLFLSGGRV